MHDASDLLQVRISVFDGPPSDQAWSTVAATLADQALAESAGELPACAILLFATADWCQSPATPLPALVRTEFQNRLGYEVQLIGGSTPRLFASLPRKGQPDSRFYLSHGVVAITFFSRDMWFSVRCLERPFSLPRAARREALSKLAGHLRNARVKHMGLGSSVQLDVLAFMPGPVLNDKGLREFNDEELFEDLQDAFKNLLRIYGGSASNDIPSTCGYQFANDQCLTSGLALALMENDLQPSAAMGHGLQLHPHLLWAPVTRLGSPDNSPSYFVAEIANEPAASFLNDWVQRGVFERGRPLFGVGTNPSCQVAATSTLPSFADNLPVRFNRRLHLGSPLFVLRGDDEQLRRGAVSVVADARQRIDSVPNHLIRLFFSVCCAGRFQFGAEFRDQSWRRCMDAMADEANSAPIVTILCSGEFAEDHRRRARADSYGLWACCFTSHQGRRSEPRILQKKLLKASVLLLTCDSPRDVMDAALSGAIDAGAEGGQICLADSLVDKILGPHIGHAKCRPGSPQRWDLVLQQTIARLPKEKHHLVLPERLRSILISPSDHLPEPGGRPLTGEDDVLEIVATERCSMWVPDSTDPQFHCHPGHIALGNIEAQFVSPLIGSGNKIIATVQIGFPTNHPMDRERMGLWAGYAQKIASALERALEREERRKIEAITKVWNDIIQAPARAGDYEAQLLRLTTVIQQQLEATYVHLRVKETFQGIVRYRLAAPVGSLAAIHPKVRPFLAEDEGSVAVGKLRLSTFTNRQESTSALYLDARNVLPGTSDELRASWLEHSETIKAAGVFGLNNRSEFIGVLVIESSSEHFFTERTKRIAEIAAQKVAICLARFKSEIYQAQVTHTGLYVAHNIHDITTPLATIQRGIDNIRGYDIQPELRMHLNCIESAKNAVFDKLHRSARDFELDEAIITTEDLLSAAREEHISIEWVNPAAANYCIKSNIWLRSALDTLLKNAEEEDPGAYITVAVADGPNIWITVENGGRILTSLDIDHMITPGYSTKPHHLGLGIPLAKFGIELAGGELILEPRTNGGLRANICLPLASQLPF